MPQGGSRSSVRLVRETVCVSTVSLPGPVDFVTGAPTSSGSLDVRWRHGVRPGSRETEPKIQVHRYDEHTFVLRQSKMASFEAPFLFLFFGNTRALLIDTGATDDPARCPVRETVDALITTWLGTHQRAAYPLVVAHTHGHGDHVAGDPQFEGRADTTVVGRDRLSVATFFGFARWPDQVVPFDLGGRVLEITGTPGHHDSSISILDRWSGFLLTGDCVYPGRLDVQDMPAFIDSLDRLLELAHSRDVRHVLGCHIEMSRTPGQDYPRGTTYQPEEPPLQMTGDQLLAVRNGAVSVADSPGAHTFDDFAIFNGPSRAAIARLQLRRVWARLREQP
jgi:hydroxyacylglutathione hydrolase